MNQSLQERAYSLWTKGFPMRNCLFQGECKEPVMLPKNGHVENGKVVLQEDLLLSDTQIQLNSQKHADFA